MKPFHVAHLLALGMWLGVGFWRRIWSLAAVAAVLATRLFISG